MQLPCSAKGVLALGRKAVPGLSAASLRAARVDIRAPPPPPCGGPAGPSLYSAAASGPLQGGRQRLGGERHEGEWRRGVALAATGLVASALAGPGLLCEEGAGPKSHASGDLTPRRLLRKKPQTAQCQVAGSQGIDRTIITLKVEKDRPGLLSEASDLLRRYHLDIRDAKISTQKGGEGAQHIYEVRHRDTGLGLPLEKLEEVRRALEDLGQVDAKTWPVITQSELQRHTTKETGIWVSYKDGVYDITNFVADHPGGSSKIMLAAGKSLDPFWRIYQQHENRGNAMELLAKMRIGTLAEPPPPSAAGADPYDSDPKDRHPGLVIHNQKPLNAELPVEMMLDSWLTPAPIWFVRHHHPVPMVDPTKYQLSVEGVGVESFNLTVEELKTRFRKHEVVATVQCGGNRRSELDRVEKTSGIPWGVGAISTARWGGVLLRDVLQNAAGLGPEVADRLGAKHVIFHAIDDMQASIPMEKALNPYGDVLLAYEMNGEPLPREHGAPIRVIVPGVVGVRNVKWLGRISVSKEEAEGAWQRGLAYKGLSPMVKSIKDIEIEKVPSVQEMPVQSVIVSPQSGTTVELDELEVRGWAWSGGGRGIVRVDVSLDGGKTWSTATLKEGSEQDINRAWAWTFWEASVPIPEHLRGKNFEVLCRATDASYSTQPERPEPIWNLRGLNCNAWHRVAVRHGGTE